MYKKILILINALFLMVAYNISVEQDIHSDQEGLRDSIYQQLNGYKLTLLDDKIPLEFQFEEQWLELKPGETIEINKVLLEKQSSTVILKSIYREDSSEDYRVILDIIQRFQDFNQGKFLSTMKIEGNSVVTRNIWSLYTKDGKELDPVVISGSGSGPLELFSVLLSSTGINQIEIPFNINYNLYLYEYNK